MREFDFEKMPIVEIANEIIMDAVRKNVSDIHMDPTKDAIRIRIRIDGILSDYSIIPGQYKRNLISRINTNPYPSWSNDFHNTWLTTGTATNLSSTRTYLMGAVVDKKFYILGGFTGSTSNPSTVVDCYDVEDTFEEIARESLDIASKNELEEECYYRDLDEEKDAEEIEELRTSIDEKYSGMYDGSSGDVYDYVLPEIFTSYEISILDNIVNTLNINDLHSGNFGLTDDDRYVIIDYAGFEVQLNVA